METDKENNDKIYISSSIENINRFISRNEYRQAFGLLILFLERIEDNDKKDVIQYYSIHMKDFGIFSGTSSGSNILPK